MRWNRICTVAALMATLFSSVSVMGGMSIQAARGEEQINEEAGVKDCSEAVHLEAHAKARALDSAKAKELASSSQGYKDRSAGLNAQYESIFNTWSVDPNCNITWNDVNVVYVVKDAHANSVKKVVVTMDPDLRKVIRLEEQPANRDAVDYHVYQNGYEFWKPAQTGNTPVYEAKATWTVSTVQPPSQGCQGVHCDMVVWAGLQSGTGGVVQGGSRGGVYCIGACSYTYKLWYQFYPTGSFTDCSTSVSPGNSVTTTVTNEKKYGLGTYDYDITILNNSSGQACTVSQGYTYMGPTPYYGLFMTERPLWGGVPARLPQFSSYTTSSASLWYSGASHPVYEPYSAGTYTDIVMRNPVSGGTQNIAKTVVSTGSWWSTSWLSSANT